MTRDCEADTPDAVHDSTSASRRGEHELREVAAFFLRLGLTAFGGPAAHIAMMEQEVVRRRAWLTHAEFLDLLGATNLIPGPSSTQMAMSIGYRRAGWIGLLLGGFCFIVPAALITLALAWTYVRFGRLPEAGALLYGIKPVVVAIVVHALWSLGKTALRSATLMAIGGVAAVASLAGVHPLIIILAAGAIALGAAWSRRTVPASALMAASVPAAAASIPTVGLLSVFLFFLKLGAILFGSGYVLLAFLKADLVDRWHWLTQAQLLDAVAAGQITPGPLFTTATFIGYVLHGFSGAAVATIGIFLPSIFFVGALGVIVPRLRQSKLVAAFLDGVNAGVMALMAVVAWQLGRTAITNPAAAAISIVSAIVLIRWSPNPTWLIAGGAAVGLLVGAL